MKASYTPVGLAIINESTPGLSAPYPVLDNVLKNVLHDDPDSGFPMLQFPRYQTVRHNAGDESRYRGSRLEE